MPAPPEPDEPRNEANHLCLLSPDGDHGRATLYTCEDIPAERWNIVTP
ncbi:MULTISPECIES: hypothetical protein [Streptomyces]|nr:hypothetical protein [Streptomyces sp. MBT27]